MAYAAGGLLVMLLVFLPYAATGNGRLWWYSVILAPLSYADSQLSLLESLRVHTAFIASKLVTPDNLMGLYVLLWAGGCAGIAAILIGWRNRTLPEKTGPALLIVFLLGTVLSILKGGGAYEHYHIQVIPFMALAAAFFLNVLFHGRARWIVGAFVVCALGPSLLPVLREYEAVLNRAADGQGLIHGTARDIAAYLEKEDATAKPVFMMTDHIVYWLLDAKPLSRSTTHPSNISKEYLLHVLVGPGTTTEMELARILNRKPAFIVIDDRTWYIFRKPAARILLEETLDHEYDHDRDIQDRKIFRRKQPGSGSGDREKPGA
jgi:hypothetical protein